MLDILLVNRNWHQRIWWRAIPAVGRLISVAVMGEASANQRRIERRDINLLRDFAMSITRLTGKTLLRSSVVGPAVVALTIAYMVTIGLVRPKYSWDTIGYVASAYQADGYSGKELSAKTFADVRAAFGEADFRRYTEGHYRSTVYHDPVSLGQQIPFYSIRMVLIYLMRVLHPLVGNYARSANIIDTAFTYLLIPA